ncbi:MAG: hypothetical protein HOP30_20005, partial [Cyclobacteriaceae bacterium]|nr:hypothetical protein [Cyclobacteriaceae bacterium]
QYNIATINGDGKAFYKAAAFVESFTIAIDGSNIVLSWENTSVSFKIAKG